MKDWFVLILIFYVRMRNGLAQMIINVEAPKKMNPVPIRFLNRASFLCKQTDFFTEGTGFCKIKL